MKNIIFFPNDINGVFVQKEYPYFKQKFDKVFIIGNGNDSEIKELVNKYDYEFIIIKNTFFKLLLAAIPALFSKDFWDEITNFDFCIREFIYKFSYAFYYQLYYEVSKKYVEKILNEYKGEFLLYSFWLSRPSYLCSHFSNHKNVSKVITRAHGFDVYLERNKYNYLPFRKYLTEHLDEIYFISISGRNYFERQIIKKDEYKKIPKLYISRLGSMNIHNAKVYYTKKIINIVSCSSITAVKRIDHIICLLQKLDIPYKWYHIGNGELFDEMKKIAVEKLPANNFEFLGYIENKKIIDSYLSINPNLFINLSDSEGIPVSIMEAISLGIPILARDVGGISEIVNNSIGLLTSSEFNDQTILECVSFIKKINEDENLFNKLQKNCIEKWCKDYDAFKNYNDFFVKVIGG